MRGRQGHKVILVMPWLAPEHQVAGSRAVLDIVVSLAKCTHFFGIDPKDGFAPAQSWLEKGFPRLVTHFGCFLFEESDGASHFSIFLYHFIISSH